MLKIAFLSDDERWKTVLKKDRAFFRSVLKKTFSYLNLPKHDFIVSVLWTNDAHIRELNADYRNKDKATNVLSFPQFEDLETLSEAPSPVEMGDIVMAFETIKREAKEQNKTFKNHTAHLLVHGLLHLAGFDHMTKEDETEMESFEIAILDSLGIKNPYLIK